jgi:hypothetical protein
MQSLKGIGIFFLLFFLSNGINAQLNIKAGYSGSYTDPIINNGILQDFNAERPWLDKKFDDVQFLSGLVLGARYRFDFVAVDVSWYGRFKRVRAEGIDPTLSTNFERRLNYNFNAYSFGIENFIGSFSLGGSIDISKMDIRTKKTGRDDRFSVVNQWGTGSHFFVSYNLETTQLQFSVRPYIQIPWTNVDLTPLAEELEVSTSGSLDENFMNFGIMFIFFNGPQ